MSFSSASMRMRSWISADCTGEPPGELIANATADTRPLNARSSSPANPARFNDGRIGPPDGPITPDKRTTETTGR